MQTAEKGKTMHITNKE